MTYVAGQRLTASALNKQYMLSDNSSTTVTAASQTRLSTAYVIAANDAQVGTVYRLIAFGSGTQATGTARTLSIRPNYAGGGGWNAYTVPATLAAVGNTFRWHAEVVVTFPAIGATAKPILFMRGLIFDVTNGTTQTALSNEFDTTGGTTVDTTSAWALQLECAWGSTTGSPTISCLATVFERGGA